MAASPWTIDDVVPVILTCVKTGNVFRRFVESYAEHCRLAPLVMQDASANADCGSSYFAALVKLQPLAVRVHARESLSVYDSVQLAAYAALRWAWEFSRKQKPILFLEDDVVFASDFREGLDEAVRSLGPKDGMLTLYLNTQVPWEKEFDTIYGTQGVLFHPKAVGLIACNQAKAMNLPPGYDIQWSQYLVKRGWRTWATKKSYLQHQEGESRLKLPFHKSQVFYEPDPSEIDRLYPAAYYRWMEEERGEYETIARVLLTELSPQRLVEFGCGNGFILEAMRQAGVEVWGLDGSLHSRDALAEGARAKFKLHDLRLPWCGGTADLVICLETAQDLPEACLDTLLESLAAATERQCVFSAATHEQMRHAANGQPRHYWQGRAAEAGLWIDEPLTARLQARLKQELSSSWWLAENMMVLTKTRPAGALTPCEAHPFWSGMGGFCYINMDHRKDRRVLIENELLRMGVAKERMHRIPGIRVEAYGGIGCTLSHIAALELALERGWETVCVMEDDFKWDQPRETLERVWREAQSGELKADVFLLDGIVEACRHHSDGWYRIDQVRNATGYVITRHYIPTLLKNLRTSVAKLQKAPSRYAEFALDQYWQRLQKKDMWLMPEMPPGTTREDVSDITQRLQKARPVRIEVTNSKTIVSKTGQLKKMN